jgi:hypothetical protein
MTVQGWKTISCASYRYLMEAGPSLDQRYCRFIRKANFSRSWDGHASIYVCTALGT